MRDAEDVRTYDDAVPEPVAQLIAKALQRERDQRFGSAREMLEALMACAPAEVRSEFRSVPSGMRRIGAGRVSRGEDGGGPAGEPAAERGDGEEPAVGAAGGAVAGSARAESGMMSVATSPSDPPELPMGSSGRPWALAAVVAAGLVLGAGALVLSSFGEAERVGSHLPGAREAEATSSAAEETALPLGAGTTSAIDAAPHGSAAGGEDAGVKLPPPAATIRVPPQRPVASALRPRAPASQRPPAPPPPAITGQTSEPSGLPLLED